MLLNTEHTTKKTQHYICNISYECLYLHMHRGIDQNIFLQKIFVKACVGTRGPDWGFPEPK